MEQFPQIPVIQEYIQNEVVRQKVVSAGLPDDRNRDWGALNNVFVEILTQVLKESVE